MNRIFIGTAISVAFILSSCGNEDKRKPVYSDYTSSTTDTEAVNDNSDIRVSYIDSMGVKMIPVKVNGIGFNMIIDTGCSSAMISVAEAEYLIKRKLLTAEDYLGDTQSLIADGSVVENMVFNLKEVIIDDKLVCNNVVVTVSDNINAPLLLGNGVLDRVASYRIDNENRQIIFTPK